MATSAVEEATQVVAPEVGASGAASEPWMNHVSIFLLDSSSLELIEFMNYATFVRLQPFYRTLADSAKAYVQVEQERDDLRAGLERLSREFLCCLTLKLLFCFVDSEILVLCCFRREGGAERRTRHAARGVEEGARCCLPLSRRTGARVC